jgi:predicted transposase/invertase (TIGR01784 family)
MASGIDPKVDFAFKRLFGSEETKPLLIELLEAVLETSIRNLELKNPFNLQEIPEGKLSVLDIKARIEVSEAGAWVDVEMQMQVPVWHPERTVYYLAKLYSDQMKEGDHYTSLCPAIAIHFLNARQFPQVDDVHLRFAISETRHHIRWSDHLEIHTIELPKFDLKPENIVTPFDRWCYFLKHGEDLEADHLPRQLQTPTIERACGVLSTMNQTEPERELYERRLKLQRDNATYEEYYKHGYERAFEKGQNIGLAEGKNIGLAEGKNIGLAEGKNIGLAEGKNIGLAEGKNIGLAEGKNIGLAEGKNIGLTEGKNIGLAEGEVKALHRTIEKMISVRFGASALEKIDGLQSIRNPVELDAMLQALIVAPSFEEFLQKTRRHPA